MASFVQIYSRTLKITLECLISSIFFGNSLELKHTAQKIEKLRKNEQDHKILISALA